VALENSLKHAKNKEKKTFIMSTSFSNNGEEFDGEKNVEAKTDDL
jgi:hypothetical protein